MTNERNQVLFGYGKPEYVKYITHHTPDLAHISVEQFSGIAKMVREMGFNAHRFDARWQQWAPDPNRRNNQYLERTAALAKSALDQRLSPIIILSTPPKWAYRKQSDEQILRHFGEYAHAVKQQFDAAGVSIPSVQILNEVNNPVYTPRRLVRLLPQLADTAKRIYGPETDLSATLLIAKPWINIARFMSRHQKELSVFDRLALDFYPASYLWNRNVLKPQSGKIIARQVLEAYATNGMQKARPDFLALLTEQATDVHDFRNALEHTKRLFPNMHIDLGEIGYPTLEPLQKRNPDHEKLQRFMINRIVDAINPVLKEFGVKKIGFYQLMDDKELGVLNWGVLNNKGEAKHIMSHLPDIIAKLGNAPFTDGPPVPQQ